MSQAKPTHIDEYIHLLPTIAQSKVQELRTVLKSVAPDATELLKWGKPAFELKTILFVYSAHKSHLTFVPTGSAIAPFSNDLSQYVINKDSIRFPYDQPLPLALIEKIARYRVEDVLHRNAKWKTSSRKR